MKKSNMQKVESSNVVSVGYEDNKLYIEYKTGTYEYVGTSRPLYEELLKAESVGRFIAARIRGIYSYKKVILED